MTGRSSSRSVYAVGAIILVVLPIVLVLAGWGGWKMGPLYLLYAIAVMLGFIYYFLWLRHA